MTLASSIADAGAHAAPAARGQLFGGRVALGAGILGLMIGAGMAAPQRGHAAELAVAVSYVVSFLAVAVSLRRGGLGGHATWVTALAAYPVLAVFITRGVLGFDFFSARAVTYQSAFYLARPMLTASSASLFIACMTTSGDLRAATAPARRPLGRAEADLLLIVVSGCASVFAWLAEPGPFMMRAAYDDIMGSRISGTAFAGPAWAAMVVVGVWAVLSRPPGSRRSVATTVFWAVFLLSSVYLLGHARRSEFCGVAVLLLAIYGYRVSTKTKVAVGSVIFVALAVIGYVRNLRDPLTYLEEDWFHLPGAPGNYLIGYVVAHSMRETGSWLPNVGETYYGHVLRLPPEALGLDRPLQAYDYVHAFRTLKGGEYFLLEPTLNFGVVGAAVFTVLLVVVLNAAIRALRASADHRRHLLGFALGGVFLSLLFRTMWYGPSAAIKGSVMAWLVATCVDAARVTVRRSAARSGAPLS
jgi:hypothetical protein